VGGTAVLCGLAIQCVGDEPTLFLPSLRKGRNSYEQLLGSLAQLYEHGYDIDWSGFHQPFSAGKRRVELPNYPFQRETYWAGVSDLAVGVPEETAPAAAAKAADVGGELRKPVPADAPGTTQPGAIIQELKKMVQAISGLVPGDINSKGNLFALGLDSLMLAQFRKKINEKYGIDISINQFFMELTTLDKIAEFIIPIISYMPSPARSHRQLNLAEIGLHGLTGAGEVEEAEFEGENDIEKVLAKRLEVIGQQLEVVKDVLSSGAMSRQKRGSSKYFKENDRGRHHPVNIRSIKLERDELTPDQENFVGAFIKRYQARTPGSMKYAREGRIKLADWINSLNFRVSLKGLIYPVVASGSQGSRFRDIDNNEYIDIAMGYGVNFFGHRPGFILDALKKQMEEGFELGPQTDLAKEVAQLICDLTGVERAAFGNTGTDVVMAALRIARTVTGRDKIVRFAGSYHGTFDGTLAETDEYGTFPTSPGTPPGMVADIIVLPYGSPESLDKIKELGEELAGVLVEPVQSRRPGFQPGEFLRQLRHLTTTIGAALIFDEVLIGFRICPGGAQEYFGVQADIVTYGKIIGGGMPIGVVAGKARFLDAVDGGVWNFTDDSCPGKLPTFFAGTFCKHPLSMAAARAALLHLKEKGPALQEMVNEKVKFLADTLNDFFEQERVPITVRYFGSLFRFESFGKYDLALMPIEMELFFYLLMEKGVYTWERRVCVLSTAHTDEDVASIIAAIKESIKELRAGGFTFSREEIASDTDPVYSLSTAQKRVYFSCQLENGEKPYHITGAWRIEGQLDIKKTRHIFKELMERHECLRTSFRMTGDKVVQLVHKAGTVECPFTHIKIPGNQLKDKIQEFIRPFDLLTPPLMRVLLLELSPEAYELVMDFHHIAADGFSLNTFSKEFVALYSGKVLPPLTIRYRDYVAWENRYLNSGKIKEHEHFWLRYFSDQLPQLDLPTDFPRPTIKSFDGKTLHFKIENQRWTQLKNLAPRFDASTFMVLLTLCNILLYKLSGSQEDIIVGTPAAVRDHGNFDPVVGMFTNTLAIRTYPGGEKAFPLYLSEVKFTCLQAYIHQEYPFDRLISGLGVSGDIGYNNPLFTVMFVYEKASERLPKIENLNVLPHDLDIDAAMFDFTFEVFEQEDHLQFNWYYDTRLFKEETIKRWIDYFEKIVGEILQNPDVLLMDIEIFTGSEKQKILMEFNHTQMEYPGDRTLQQLFREQAKKTPDHIVINYPLDLSADDFHENAQNSAPLPADRGNITYKELNNRSRQLAGELRKKGVNAENIVGIMMDTPLEMAIGILGILEAEGAYLPLDPAYPGERVKYMIEDSGINLVAVDHKTRAVLTRLSLARPIELIIASPYKENSSPGDSKKAVGLNLYASIAYVIYTSGTTGKPKGVPIEHRSVVNTLLYRKDEYKMDSRVTALQLFSYSFDGFLTSFFTPVISGARVILLHAGENGDIMKIKEAITKNKVTHFICVPVLYKSIIENLTGEDAASLQAITLAGDKILPDILNATREKNKDIEIIPEYGVTEAAVMSTIYRHQEQDSQIKIGRPIGNTTIYILDKNHRLMAPGVPGELCIGGKGLGRGYLNKPGLSKEKFLDNPYRPGQRIYKTGDLCRWLEDGNIEFLGRIDNQVKIRGFRIELGEIESWLLKTGEIKETVVVNKKDKNDHEYLCAYIVTAHPPDIQGIRAGLAEKIPAYMIPARFVRLDKIPLTSNGKIDRRSLPEPELKAGNEYVAPRDEVEKKFVEIWQEVLGIEKVGINDSFFLLGGDSIKSIQIASRLNKAGYKIDISQLIHHPTISQLAAVVKRPPSLLKQAIVQGKFPLTPMQRKFFAKPRTHWNHYNQAALLQVPGRLEEEIARTILSRIQEHHDALRITFKEVNGEIIQENHGTHYPLSLEVHDFCGKKNASRMLEDKIDEIRTNISPKQGPLMKSALFYLDDGTRLLIAVHRLVIDEISWRIIWEDLEMLYQQYIKKEKLQLQLKTDSYKSWAEKLYDYSKTGDFLREKEYWKEVESRFTGLPRIETDRENSHKPGSTGEPGELSFSLSEQETQNLMTQANEAFGTETSDILITALGWGIKEIYGMNRLVIFLMGHGREQIAEDIDISRTIGWFNHEYPVIVDFSYTGDIARQIKEVKETLNKVPGKGIGYGVLEYLTRQENQQDINFKPGPQIHFNLNGHVDGNKAKTVGLSLLNKYPAHPVHFDGAREYDLGISAVIINKCLNISIAYNNNQYQEKSIRLLANNFKKSLSYIISFCSEREEKELTPSDLDFNDFSIEELENFFS